METEVGCIVLHLKASSSGRSRESWEWNRRCGLLPAVQLAITALPGVRARPTQFRIPRKPPHLHVY
jgi:hypothetical protein